MEIQFNINYKIILIYNLKVRKIFNEKNMLTILILQNMMLAEWAVGSTIKKKMKLNRE